MLNVLLSIITSRLTWSFFGVTAISAIIGFLGPIITIGNIMPLKSMTARITTIILFFLVWALAKLIPRLYRLWVNKNLEKQLNINRESNSQTKQSEQYSTLAERFSNATRLLKKAYFSGLYHQNKPGWTKLFSRQYIYQLPWYLVIGASHSGKTTALSNSGLHYSLVDHLGKFAQYQQQPTNDINWWFTNHAVLLDTSGRYTSQPNANSQDAGEWNKLIQLLKKYRARQPINGIIITVSVDDLLTQPSEKRNQQAYILSKRLSELHEKFKIQIPIYILITKTDLLKGFSAYFNHFDKASREQIWGFDFPWGNKLQYQLIKLFEKKYQELQSRLNAELPTVLLNEYHPKQCAESYLFPQEIASLRPLIAQYLEGVFAKSNFEIPCHLRGLYFTSGTQDCVPIDNVMAQFNRQLKLPTNNGSNSMSWENDKGAVSTAPANQAYFLKNVLENIFREAGIASHNRWWVYRKRLLNGTGYVILIATLVFVSKLFLASYNNNHDYLSEVGTKISNIVRQDNALEKNTDNIYTLLPLLNNLANLDNSPSFSLDKPPLSYRMGLYRGKQVSEASRALYQKTLKSLLLPQVVKFIKNQMQNDHANDDIEKIYNTLKAYQMLYQPQYYDGKFLHDWVMQYLETYSGADITQKQLQQINQHLRQLLDNQIVTSPFVRDTDLVKKKQKFISKIPPAQRAYNYLKNKLLDDPNLTSVTLDTLAGPQATLVFSDTHETSSTNGISGMFTPAGYRKGIDKDLKAFLTTLYSQDNWVLGPYAKKLTTEEIQFFVKQLYIDDYISQWDNFLAGIHLNHNDNLEQRTNTARLLSSSDSPLRNLLINIDKNVTLNNALTNAVPDKNSALSKQFNKVAKKPLPDKSPDNDNQRNTPELELEKHFAPITALATNPNGKNNPKIPFDETLEKIGELYQYLISVQNAVKTDIPFPPNNIIVQLQAASERLPMPFKNMVSSLTLGASSDSQISDMKNVAKHLNAEIGTFCHQAIANRYPLTPKAQQEIKPDDMARMFASETGLMDRFFQKNLVGKIDTTQPKWQFMPGVNGKTLPGGEALLKPFQQAQIVRNTLFISGTPSPLFNIMVRPVSMDNDILSMILDVDGQKLQYSHGPQLSQLISWPGPNKTNQVHIQLNLSNGTTVNLSTAGFWALNRLLDHAQKLHSVNADDTGMRATFNIKGHSVSLDFIPNSVLSPFKLPAFSCPSSKMLTA
ncbi:type VI secretion system membrane subunit TssM [Xenorhabdus sp. ZM]|uniref:type VI secretion system membrane subunit TssM n=1 Tax=Xenorhabdus szentirmaii TaxID=290112 RepID=UPI0019B3256D|nr:type VI secretion system membrane subunit TssM [Xenorhabdus sp. ZM]MBD2805775.1 type VI secretion system membrane subunit TssM [Xenorhabdus sp. ZM]